MSKHTKNEKVETEQLTATEGFFDQYKNYLFFGLGGVVVIFLAYLAYHNFVSKPKELESQEAIWQAFYDLESDSLTTAAQGTDEYMGFEEAADEYNGTSGGDIANYSMGVIKMEEGDFEAALDYFDECDFDDVMLGSITIGLKGDCYVELNELDKAVKYFKEAAEREANEYTTPLYLKKAGLTYEEMEEFDKALEVYTQIKTEYPQSTEGQDIDKYIARATK